MKGTGCLNGHSMLLVLRLLLLLLLIVVLWLLLRALPVAVAQEPPRKLQATLLAHTPAPPEADVAGGAAAPEIQGPEAAPQGPASRAHASGRRIRCPR